MPVSNNSFQKKESVTTKNTASSPNTTETSTLQSTTSAAEPNLPTIVDKTEADELNTSDNITTNMPLTDLDTTANISEPQISTKISGLTNAELNDPNCIKVTISDGKAPLIILFGPPACGKTMTLVRLTRFLQSEGYTVAPIRTFRPSADTNYTYICDHFNDMMNSGNAAKSTDRISFMLVEVIKNGRRLCQILEAPGEYYFDPEKPDASFPNYINTIISSSNRKIWVIMTEPDWKNHEDRTNYVRKISHLKQNMRTKDSTVFVLNKIDLTNFVISVGNINNNAATNEVKNLYPGIFKPFENKNPITRFWQKYNCEFVAFQTGFYTEAITGMTYQEGPGEYCANLWNTIMKKIRG